MPQNIGNTSCLNTSLTLGKFCAVLVVLPCLPQLDRLRPALTLPHSIVNSGMLQPLLQRQRMNTEIFRDLLDRHSEFTIAGDAYDIITDLSRVRPRHNNIFPGRLIGQARSDVT